MPAANRDLEITYGSRVIGGTTDYLIDGKYTQTDDAERFTVSVDVIATGTTYANFLTACTNLETDFSNPYEDLVIKFGASTFRSFKESDGTGFNQQPSISKVGDAADGGLSRKYRIIVSIEKPFGENSARKTGTINLHFEPSRRRILTLTGTYTVSGANSARAQYNASIAAYQASTLSSLGGTWELVTEDADTDDRDKTCDFIRVLEEVIFNQSDGLLNHTAIVQSRMHWSRQIPAPGDSPSGVRRLDAMTIGVQCWIDKDVSTDIEGLWENTVKPHLIKQAESFFAPKSMAIIDESHGLEPTEYKLTGTLTIQSVSSDAGDVLQLAVTTIVSNGTGFFPAAVWNGNRHAKHVFQGPSNIVRTTTVVARIIGHRVISEPGGSINVGGLAGAAGAGGGGGGGGGGGQSYAAGLRNLMAFAFGVPGASIGFGLSGSLTNAAAGIPGKGEGAGVGGGAGGGAAGGAAGGGGGGNWMPITDPEITTTPLTLGYAPNTIDVTDVTIIRTELYYENPGGRTVVATG